MDKLSAVIIEDEENGRLALREKLNNYCPDVIILGEAADGIEGIDQIKKLAPDVVFLDIEMPQLDGFEMLQSVTNIDFHIIFTTAYDHYAIKAIRYSALDYLLKPVDIEELKSAVERARTYPVKWTREKINTLHINLKTNSSVGKIAIPTSEGYSFFPVSEIVHLKAESNYTMLFFQNDTRILASRTLKEFEEILPEGVFYRTHHSHIINLTHIKKYIREDGGQIVMLNEKYIPLSRRKKRSFFKALHPHRYPKEPHS